MKMRADSWKVEEDKLLAETVLKFIQNGGTQIEAFEEVGVILNRTSAAVGYRWNSLVRKQYTEQIKEAKKNRLQFIKSEKSTKKPVRETKKEVLPPKEEVTMSTEHKGANFNKEVTEIIHKVQDVVAELQKSRSENELLKLENAQLKHTIETQNHDFQSMETDYHELLKVFNRAKNLFLFDEVEKKSTLLKQTANG